MGKRNFIEEYKNLSTFEKGKLIEKANKLAKKRGRRGEGGLKNIEEYMEYIENTKKNS